jgi:hypothetical protein
MVLVITMRVKVVSLALMIMSPQMAVGHEQGGRA